MQTVAKHLLVELHDCARVSLNDLELIRGLMRRAARAAGATVVGEAFHSYVPHGLTGVLVIEESHFSVHTWPEAGYAALDFYTCGTLEPEAAARIVSEGLGAQSVSLLEVLRGLDRASGGPALSVSRRASW